MRGWYSFADHIRDVHGPGIKVFKIPLDAGFTCPNIDGTVAHGGCTYCNNRSFSPPTRTRRLTLAEQVASGIDYYRSRYKACHFYAYFQAWTNTHAPIERLRVLYDEALTSGDFLGLDIGTRPDCAGEEVLDLIESYAEEREVWIEYGLQTVHDTTARATNRGHGFDAFADAVALSFPERLAVKIAQREPFGVTEHVAVQVAERVALRES